MVKILVINSGIHEKNKQGIAMVLNYLKQQQQIEYKIGTIADIPNYDVVYDPSQAINTSIYPKQKFIFGPHFSVFPRNQQLQSLQSKIQNNSIYIQPSEWAARVWQDMSAEQFLPIKIYPFPVAVQRFAPTNTIDKRTNVLIYFKRRKPAELNQLKELLKKYNIINYRIFDYTQHYNEADYLSYLQTCNYGIILDAHESQGFAIEEALSCDVPLLVWNAQTMNQESNSTYKEIPCTTIPYWDERCGEYFHHAVELETAFTTFQSKLTKQEYHPREYILENLSTEKCAERFMELIKF
jgi:hypothetical protein